jgi:hypothetical protein
VNPDFVNVVITHQKIGVSKKAVVAAFVIGWIGGAASVLNDPQNINTRLTKEKD